MEEELLRILVELKFRRRRNPEAETLKRDVDKSVEKLKGEK